MDHLLFILLSENLFSLPAKIIHVCLILFGLVVKSGITPRLQRGGSGFKSRRVQFDKSKNTQSQIILNSLRTKSAAPKRANVFG